MAGCRAAVQIMETRSTGCGGVGTSCKRVIAGPSIRPSHDTQLYPHAVQYPLRRLNRLLYPVARLRETPSRNACPPSTRAPAPPQLHLPPPPRPDDQPRTTRSRLPDRSATPESAISPLTQSNPAPPLNQSHKQPSLDQHAAKPRPNIETRAAARRRQQQNKQERR
ncbi:hypothetical protein IWX90DRAFT_27860 [Phyllosticta citrichinensis]|uniref:Uncharacterized protein n=1 Tax=Phyllosticta citrichinensis TaxID=1130410 RepID=A0ABR1Y7L6_9PEZI